MEHERRGFVGIPSHCSGRARRRKRHPSNGDGSNTIATVLTATPWQWQQQQRYGNSNGSNAESNGRGNLVMMVWHSSIAASFTFVLLYSDILLHTSGKKICVRMHRLRPDTPGAQDALEEPCQRTYRSQCKTHRQWEFGRSSPRHRVSGRRSPRHLLTGRSMAEYFPSGCTVSGHFPSGRSRVRAFSFRTQPCQGIFLLDASG